MADGFNPSVALDVKPPDIDISKPLNALANIRMSNARSTLYTQQAQLQAMKINALQQYGQAVANSDDNGVQDAIGNMGAIDPDMGNSLLKLHQAVRQAKAGNTFSQNPTDTSVFDPFPEMKQTVTDTLAKQDANTRANTEQRMIVGGQAADMYLNDPSVATWNAALDTMQNSKLFTPQELAQYRNNPNSIMANQLKAASMHTKDWMEANGEQSSKQTRDLPPEASVYTPPSAGTSIPPNLVGPQVGKGQTALPSTPPVSGPQPNQPAAGTQSGQADIENDPRYKEVPQVNLNSTPPQPGIVHQGQEPAVLAAKAASIEHYNKDLVPASNSAQKQQSELGTLRSTFQSGAITPGKTAELRNTIAGYLYEGTGHNLELTRQLTGIDPSAGDIANKESTRLGFDMSREQGAREAVQVIQFAMGANPNMLNTKEGALKLIDLLDKTAQWNVDKSDYAGKYIIKNGHAVGFDNWYNHNHPLEEQTSKVVPYQYDGNPQNLKDKATYEYKDKTGAKQQGVWNASAQHFE